MSEQHSYRQIMKATSLFGGVQVFTILIGIIRSKIVAVLLGSTGFGIMGLFQTTISLIQSVSSVGIPTSAVREISEANSNENISRVSAVVKSFYRWLWFTGLLGAVVTLSFAEQFSRLTFGNKEYTWAFVWLSVVLLLNSISSGQNAILQGMRKLKHLALATLYGSLLGLITSLPLYYLYGLKGIVPALIITALTTFLLNFYFVRKIEFIPVDQNWNESFHQGKTMVKLGFVMMLSGFMVTLVSYVINIIISNKGGIAEVGLYRAGWTITTQYTGLIFTAMATDYFPRLAAIQNNRDELNKTVNQQAEIALLLLGPMVIALIGFAPFVTRLLYSKEFFGIVEMIQWTMLGMLFKAASWALAFTIIAKGDNRLFLITETIGNAIIMVLNIGGYLLWGLNGIGISFTVSYIMYFLLIFYFVRSRYGIICLNSFWKLFCVQTLLAIVTFALYQLFHSINITLLILIIFISAGLFSLFELNKRIALKELLVKFKR